MKPYDRLPRRSGVLLALALTTAGAAGLAAGCAPACYDDGLFQHGCSSADGAVGTTSGTTGTETSATSATGSGDGVVMTADGESGSSGGPTICPGLDEELSYGTPTFQLVVEHSNAMLDAFGGGTRWDAVEEALVDMPDGEITQRQSLARFGFTAYEGVQATCPRLDTVSPQLDAADEIAGVFVMNDPQGANPVGETLEVVVDDLEADAWDGQKTIVLVLGGEPTTCMLPAPGNPVDLAITREAAETAVTDAFVAGFPTVVVTLGDDVDAGFLQVLANAGIGQQPGDPDATFYVTQDEQELADAFGAIFDPGRPCSFTLDTALPAELAPGCTVEVNGAAVGYDDANGWGRVDDQTVELRGTACESIQQGDASVAMVCSCDDV